MQIVINVSAEVLAEALKAVGKGQDAKVVAEAQGVATAGKAKGGRPTKEQQAAKAAAAAAAAAASAEGDDFDDEETTDEAGEGDDGATEDDGDDFADEPETIDAEEQKKLKAALRAYQAKHGKDKTVAILMKLGGSKASAEVAKANLPKLMKALKV